MRDLRLYSRQGCCLCAGLEERLRQLDLDSLQLTLTTVDIDHPETPSEWKARYDLEVWNRSAGSFLAPEGLVHHD